MRDEEFYDDVRNTFERNVHTLTVCGINPRDADIASALLHFLKYRIQEHFGRYSPALYRTTLRKAFG